MRLTFILAAAEAVSHFDQSTLACGMEVQLMTMDPASIYAQLSRLAEDMPDFTAPGRVSNDSLRWLGRVNALLDEMGLMVDSAGLTVATKGVQSYNMGIVHDAIAQIRSVLYRALGTAELRLPAGTQGAFLPAGNVFEAFAVVGKVLRSAKRDLLIVDPYMDERTLTDFAPLASDGVVIRLLADGKKHYPSLLPAAQRWSKQYATARPLQVRAAPARALHDRLIICDGTETWVVTQSFNAIAERAPASVVPVDDEMAKLKVEAYHAVWQDAAPLI